MAHQDPHVLSSLLRLIDDPRNSLFVHIDQRSVDLSPALVRGAVQASSVDFVRRRKVFWGHYSQIQVAMDLLREASGGHFDYYHVISGADLPLKTPDEIHQFFDAHQGREFIGFAPTFDPSWVSERHLFNRFLMPRNRVQRLLRDRGSALVSKVQQRVNYDHSRKFGLEIRKGSDWYSVTHAMVEHVLASETLVRRLLRFGHAPSEIYMQTLAWNSPFREKLFDESDEFRGSARLIDWDRGGPHTFTIADLDELMCSDRMFARKFMSSIDRLVVDRLVEHLS